MMTTGSQMRISSANFTAWTMVRNSLVKIPKLRLPLSMMISQDRLSSLKLRLFKLWPVRNLLIL